MAALLELQGATLRFGGLTAVNAVDLTIGEDELCGLIGPNGAGKTTVFNLITGVYPPSAGALRFRGRDLAGLRPDEITALGIARTFQNIRLFGRLSVLDNLRMGLAPCPASTSLPPELYELFPVLEQMQHRRGGDLSGGQQQQLAIARALAAGPKVLREVPETRWS